jgi:hypothetical protein
MPDRAKLRILLVLGIEKPRLIGRGGAQDVFAVIRREVKAIFLTELG